MWVKYWCKKQTFGCVIHWVLGEFGFWVNFENHYAAQSLGGILEKKRNVSKGDNWPSKGDNLTHFKNSLSKKVFSPLYSRYGSQSYLNKM